jgi:hypothetical protein
MTKAVARDANVHVLQALAADFDVRDQDRCVFGRTQRQLGSDHLKPKPHPIAWSQRSIRAEPGLGLGESMTKQQLVIV